MKHERLTPVVCGGAVHALFANPQAVNNYPSPPLVFIHSFFLSFIQSSMGGSCRLHTQPPHTSIEKSIHKTTTLFPTSILRKNRHFIRFKPRKSFIKIGLVKQNPTRGIGDYGDPTPIVLLNIYLGTRQEQYYQSHSREKDNLFELDAFEKILVRLIASEAMTVLTPTCSVNVNIGKKCKTFSPLLRLVSSSPPLAKLEES